MNVSVFHPSAFVWASPHGVVDVQAGKSLLGDIAALAEPLERFEVLIDLRKSEAQLNADELWELAASLVCYRGTFLRRTAILCPPRQYEQARRFTLMAASHGFARIRPFVGYEDAVHWLIAGTD